MANKINIRLNSKEKIEQILQEAYDLTQKMLFEVQNEINKLSNSCNLGDTSIEDKAKYAKAMHDYIGDKDKVLARKFEIAKFMGEVMKHNGDVSKTVNDKDAMKGMGVAFDMDELRKTVKTISGGDDTPATYELKKR